MIASRLLSASCTVADIDSRCTEGLQRHAVDFVQFDLMQGRLPHRKPYDLTGTSEMIEHVPRLPHLVSRDLRKCLRDDGILVLTTLNLFRLRNLVRMLTGWSLLNYFRLLSLDHPIGRFVEYDLDRMKWKFQEGGFEILSADVIQLDHGGATAKARFIRHRVT